VQRVLQPTATAVTVAVAASQPVTNTDALAASQPVTETLAAPAELPGTGGDFSQGVPWVVMLLVLGALVTLGVGRLSNKPTV